MFVYKSLSTFDKGEKRGKRNAFLFYSMKFVNLLYSYWRAYLTKREKMGDF